MNIIFIAISLALDAFSVSLIKGFLKPKLNFTYIFIIALYFGLFQGLMPLLGYFSGNLFYSKIVLYDHYIILLLLGGIGLNMIISSKDNKYITNSNINFKEMIMLAIATSIDAYTVGITFTFLINKIFITSFIIALITFIMSFIGVVIGHKFGTYFDNKIEIVGGLILISLGIKMFLSHI